MGIAAREALHKQWAGDSLIPSNLERDAPAVREIFCLIFGVLKPHVLPTKSVFMACKLGNASLRQRCISNGMSVEHRWRDRSGQ